MDEPFFHVLLDGRRIGPYGRRTIVGMRIKKALTSAHVLVDADGRELTVGELIATRGPRPPEAGSGFQPGRSGSYSLVQAAYPAGLVGVEGRGAAVPAFKGEIEARVQTGVLRLAGRVRSGFGWKDARVKLPLDGAAYARVAGSQVDLWFRQGRGKGFQRVTLELFTPEAAGELVEFLPNATPWPEAVGRVSQHHLLWVAVAGLIGVFAIVMAVLLLHRPY